MQFDKPLSHFFLSAALSSQEVDLIREQVQQLISLPMWMCLLPVRCQTIILIKNLWCLFAHHVMAMFANSKGMNCFLAVMLIPI